MTSSERALQQHNTKSHHEHKLIDQQTFWSFSACSSVYLLQHRFVAFMHTLKLWSQHQYQLIYLWHQPEAPPGFSPALVPSLSIHPSSYSGVQPFLYNLSFSSLLRLQKPTAELYLIQEKNFIITIKGGLGYGNWTNRLFKMFHLSCKTLLQFKLWWEINEFMIPAATIYNSVDDGDLDIKRKLIFLCFWEQGRLVRLFFLQM